MFETLNLEKHVLKKLLLFLREVNNLNSKSGDMELNAALMTLWAVVNIA